jgi:hypothetical protein
MRIYLLSESQVDKDEGKGAHRKEEEEKGKEEDGREEEIKK